MAVIPPVILPILGALLQRFVAKQTNERSDFCFVADGWDRAPYRPGGHRPATLRGWHRQQLGEVAGRDELLCQLPWPGPCMGV